MVNIWRLQPPHLKFRNNLGVSEKHGKMQSILSASAHKTVLRAGATATDTKIIG